MRVAGMWMPKKIRTKISLITMYGFILFYVRVKQISVASGTVMANEWIRLERLPREKKWFHQKCIATHWSGTWTFGLAGALQFRHSKWYIFATLHFSLLYFNLLLSVVLFFSRRQKVVGCVIVCVCVSLRLCSKVNVLLRCFDVQLRHCCKPITKFMWK